MSRLPATCMVILALCLPATHAGEPARITFVACAPGYPGDTEQAQPSMDAFALGVARAAGWEAGERLRAVYHPVLEAGLERLAQPDAAIALVPLPFYLEYRRRLGLAPLLEVIQSAGSHEVWSVVARRGAVAGPASLAGWELAGMAGYTPRFVRSALSGWGAMPGDVTIRFSSRVLSVLRDAAGGGPVAALLDRSQTEALAALPFASELEVVAHSDPMPTSLVCRVGDRLSDESSAHLVRSLLALHETAAGAELLESIRIVRFAKLDRGALDRLEAAFDGVAD